jgi:hypothetical protein
MTLSQKALDLAGELVGTLPVDRPNLFNPWRQVCEFDLDQGAFAGRLSRLALHLDCNPQIILVGEAPSYQGCRYTGIAFTSERQLAEGAIDDSSGCVNDVARQLRDLGAITSISDCAIREPDPEDEEDMDAVEAPLFRP